MGLQITFDLSEEDLKHFRLIMAEARAATARLGQREIIAAAQALLGDIRKASVPEFIEVRLERLGKLIAMVTDREWKLPDDEVTRVVNALAYFSDPEDLIHDEIPGLGFLDDAIMIELATRELKHELDAYDDFCRFRDGQAPPDGGEVTRGDWLKSRRDELQNRMRERRSPLSLF